MTRNANNILHVFPTFDMGGAQSRTATIINNLADGLTHTVLALDGKFGADRLIDRNAAVRFLRIPKSQGGIFGLSRVIRASRADLVLTYNWGAIDAILAAKLAGTVPVIHTEDGFGVDEARRLKLRRVLARRIVLNRIYSTVVPSQTLENVALTQYRIARGKLRLILNGIDTDKFAPRRNRAIRSRLGVGEEGVLFGYVGQLRPEKNLDFLLRTFAGIASPARRLAFIGDGSCRKALESAARDLGISPFVSFVGSIDDPAPYYNALDAFVLSSVTEQMPMALLEAMASGLPAVCTAVGDVTSMLKDSVIAPVAVGDEREYSAALRAVAGRVSLRAEAGDTNRKTCVDAYSSRRMLAEYSTLYRGALNQSQQRRVRDLPAMATARDIR